jgi:hypothetical protein
MAKSNPNSSDLWQDQPELRIMHIDHLINNF